MLEEELEGGIQDEWAAALGAKMGGSLARLGREIRPCPAPTLDDGIAHFLPMVAFSYSQ
jgi:hypothetical protein